MSDPNGITPRAVRGVFESFSDDVAAELRREVAAANQRKWTELKAAGWVPPVFAEPTAADWRREREDMSTAGVAL